MFFPSRVWTLVAGFRQLTSGARSIRKRRPTTSTLAVPAITLESRALPSATPVGGEILVQEAGDDTNALPVGQSIATNAEGDFVVTWRNFSTDGTDIMARLYNADGTPAGDAFLVNTTAANGQDNPSVAMNASGEFVIVWDSAADSGTRYDIMAQRYDANGVAQGTEFRVNADEDAWRQYAKVAMDADGGFAITWRDFDSLNFTESSVYVRRFDADGVALSDAIIANNDLGFHMDPNVAMTPSGEFILTWMDSFTIYARQFDADGTPTGAAIELGSNDFATNPSVAVDQDGNFLVSWTGATGGNNDVIARLVTSEGVAVGTQFVVNTTTLGSQGTPTVATTAEGNFVIFWLGDDVYARVYDAEGLPLGNEFVVHDVAGEVAMTPGGKVVVDWVESFPTDIYVQQYLLNAAPTNLSLSANTVAENSASGTVVGMLSSTDADADDSFTYTLVSGAGDTGNGSFQIVDNELRTNTSFNFEAQMSYSVRVMTTDAFGATFEKTFTIQVTNVAETQAVTLSNDSVEENQPAGTVVGQLALTDAVGEVQFKLVGGEGSSGNAKFKIVDGQLVTKSLLNADLQSSYSVRVQARDSEGNITVQVFEIEVENINEAVTGIRFDAEPLAENAAIGTLAGTLSAIDLDGEDSWTYTLVAGDGATDNAMFSIDGSSIETASVLDYETQSTYSVRVRATDAGGLFFERVIVIRLNNVNEPLPVTLSNDSVEEGQPAGTVVGNLGLTGAPDGPLQFKLVSGEDSSGNAKFKIVGNQLVTKSVLNFEQQSSYSVRVQVTDSAGNISVEVFEIEVENINEAVTGINFAAAPLSEGATVGTVAGVLSAIDPDAGDTWTYTLVAGVGATDNASFSIDGNQIETGAALDFETKSTYSVRVRATDAGGLWFERVVTIRVSNVNESPTAITLSNASILGNRKAGTTIGKLTGIDPDGRSKLTFSLVTGAVNNNQFQIKGNVLKSSEVLDPEVATTLTVRVRVTDADGLFFDQDFAISVLSESIT
jgi:hypothetical protein